MKSGDRYFNIIDNGGFFDVGVENPPSPEMLMVVASTGCLDENTKIMLNSRCNKEIKTLSYNKIFSILSYNFKNKSLEKDFARLINSGKKRLYEIKLKNKLTILASEDHIFYDSKFQEIKLKDLKIGDEILVKN